MGSTRKARSSDFVSSRPWIVFRKVESVPVLLGRFANPVRARSLARERRGMAEHIDALDAETRTILGLHG